MIENNIKKFKIVEGGIKLSKILKKDGTLVRSYNSHNVQDGGSDKIYNYKGNTMIKHDHKLIIAGAVEASVNHVVLQLDHSGIKLKEIRRWE